MAPYPWYEIVGGDEPVLQGDFLAGCPVISPTHTAAGETVATEVCEYDVVVMSQSCDLVERKVDLVLVCPYWSLGDFGTREAYFQGRQGREQLRRGNVTGYHLLNRQELEQFQSDYLVVDFRNVYGVPFSFLTDLARQKGRRVRLLPPYREHLSQAFARFFMRVGLPVDIPAFR